MVPQEGDMGAEEHQNPGVRVCQVLRPAEGGSCGFHLTRTKWDPYPWVCGVDHGSAAHTAGLKVGDCVLEVNGEDVLGLRVSEIAPRVRARQSDLTLLLWNSGVDPHCDPESLCCGPMPTSLQRLSTCMSSILAVLECPVCLDTIPPPAHQCGNGHLVCGRCRAHSERCPVCRVRLSRRGRSLLAEKVYNSLTEAFLLTEEPLETRAAKMRQRLNGKKQFTEYQRRAYVKPTLNVPRNKFLTRIMGKSSSVENLSTTQKSAGKQLLSLDFAQTLTTKSLSSNEIFSHNNLAPAVSQVSFVSSEGGDVGFTSSPSFQGSMESLTQRIMSDFGEPELTDDGVSYHCPFSADCSSKLRRPSMFRHLQHQHGGPLVQYFTPEVVTDVPPCIPDRALITMTTGGNVYFVKVLATDKDDLLVWTWVLGGKFKAESLKLNVTLKADDVDSPELSFKYAVHSLAIYSWTDIVLSNKGIIIKKDAIAATFKNEKIKLHLHVMSNATPATPV